MCGRYSATSDLKTLKDRFGFGASPEGWTPRGEIFPTQEAPVIVEEDGRRLKLYRWGLIPSWAKDPKIGNKMINARAETIMEKPSFKRPFQMSRCLVPADGFYEWTQDPEAKSKTKISITLKSRAPFAMAGLWERWEDPSGKDIRTYTIITTAASETIKSVHDRMPVLLDREGEALWLDKKTRPEKLKSLLLPWAGETLELLR